MTPGKAAPEDGTIAIIVKARARSASLDISEIAGQSLKRGALNAEAVHGAEPQPMKQLGWHGSYQTPAVYFYGARPSTAIP